MSDLLEPESSGWLTKKRLQQVITGVIVLVLITAIIGLTRLFNLPRLTEDLELKSYDLRVALNLPGQPTLPSPEIVIVTFDDTTLSLLQEEFGTWPWPRSVHAEMIDFFNRLGVRAIAYDIMFVGRKKGEDAADQALVKAFHRHANVYLSMNLDNDRLISEKLGKGLTPDDIRQVEPLALDFVSRLKPKPGLVDELGFFQNRALTYNHYRRLLPGLTDNSERIAFANHNRDADGISRSNPLVFRFIYTSPVVSAAKPYRQLAGPKGPVWQDAKGRPINRHGVLRNADGTLQTSAQIRYFPYTGLRLAMDLLLPPAASKQVTLAEDGTLRFAGRQIPLTRDGAMLIRWHNVNIEHLQLQAALADAQAQLNALQSQASPTAVRQRASLQQSIASLKMALEIAPTVAKPYLEIPAWQIIQMMREKTPSFETAGLRKFLKNKIVFVGVTAVSNYDIKTTPIHKMLPGVVLQANAFDNIFQNTVYLKRLEPIGNWIISGVLALVAAFGIYSLRSALAGILYALVVLLIYIGLASVIFKNYGLWINIAQPGVTLIITTIATFMIKYILKSRDYELTYQLATTDSMTGLFNHRYFQDHLRKSMAQAQQTALPVSLLLIDIDFFKKFNDTYGHQAGDEVLRQVARKLRQSVRDNDVVARYGGEEMAIVLNKADEQRAVEIGRKIVQMVASEPYPIAEGVSKHVTISLGVATYPVHGKTPAELIEFADKGLYRAKENGRNQVGALFDDSTHQVPTV